MNKLLPLSLIVLFFLHFLSFQGCGSAKVGHDDLPVAPASLREEKNAVSQRVPDSATETVVPDAVQDNRAVSDVHCQCEIREYDPAYFFCDHDLVAEGDPHSQGEYPMFTIALRSPRRQAGRVVNVIFQSGEFGSSAGSNQYKGKSCEVALPADFLDGDYKTITGDAIENFVILPAMAPGDASYRIEEPIVLGGHIVGDIKGGVFTPLNWDAVELPDALYAYQRDDASLSVDFVRIPEALRTYDNERSALLTPQMAHLDLNCGGLAVLDFKMKENGRYPSLLGMDAKFNPTPRQPVKVTTPKEKWADGVLGILKREGKPAAPVVIQSIYQVDILNDGKPDTVVFAAHTEWTGPCKANTNKNGCGIGGYFDADKSYGLVAVAMNGQAPLERVVLYFFSQLQWTLDNWMFADVNGDGILEFVYDISYFEGSWVGVLNMSLPDFPEFISMDCML